MVVVLYAAPPPSINSSSSKVVKDWTKVRLPKSQRTNLMQTHKPRIAHTVVYLSTFYHSLSVKVLSERLKFATWSDDGGDVSESTKASSIIPAVALQTSTEAIRAHYRSLTTRISFAQLNLNDLLDTDIAILPQECTCSSPSNRARYVRR